jgi:hypothetical protein
VESGGDEEDAATVQGAARIGRRDIVTSTA